MRDLTPTNPDPGPPGANSNRAAVNRANARASTGPKSTAGKATVARNALRHGLTAMQFANLRPEFETAALARGIAGQRAPPERFAAALCIAPAQIDLQQGAAAAPPAFGPRLESAESRRERTLTSAEIVAATMMIGAGGPHRTYAEQKPTAKPAKLQNKANRGESCRTKPTAGEIAERSQPLGKLQNEANRGGSCRTKPTRSLFPACGEKVARSVG